MKLRVCFAAALGLSHVIAAPAHGQWTSEENYQPAAASAELTGAVGVGVLKEPGSGPNATTMIVAQLRGAIFGVARDGETRELIVDEDVYRPVRELPHFDGETGQTGACVSRDDRYLFTTSVAKSGWERTNRIVRWQIKKSAEGQVTLTRDQVLNSIFQDAPAKNAHQIGHCIIDRKNRLWVGTGDGHNPALSHDINHANGKILRMNLDFSAVKENPFFDPDAPNSVRSYVYASGFRNPFSIAEGPGEQFFAADNGPMYDRIVELQKGRDYLWDNTDESMTFNNLAVFPQQYGPSGLLYVPPEHPGAGALGGHLVMAASHKAKILAFPYQAGYGITDTAKTVVASTQSPKPRLQDFSGVTLTPEGLVVSHIRMTEKGGLVPTPLWRLDRGQSTVAEKAGMDLVVDSGCRGCHVVGGVGSAMGPNLDNIVLRLRDRLGQPDYLAEIKNHPGGDAFAELREKMIAQEGSVDDRIKLWLAAKIEHPTFDNPSASMAALNLPDDTIDKLVNVLMDQGNPTAAYDGEPGWYRQLRFKLAQNPRIPLAMTLIFGFGLGMGSRLLGRRLIQVVRRFKR